MKTTQTRSDLDRITDALDLSGLSAEEQEEILVDIHDLVLKGTIVRLIERMDDATRVEFTSFMEEGPTEDQISDFIEERMPETDDVVEETIRDFADDILAVTA